MSLIEAQWRICTLIGWTKFVSDNDRRLFGAKPLYACLFIVNNFQWDLNQITSISISEYEFEMSSAKWLGLSVFKNSNRQRFQNI